MKVARIREIRELDRKAVEIYGIDEEILMENAGIAVHLLMRDEFGCKNKNFLVVCGTGNNGGDGMVVARRLLSDGAFVKVLVVGDERRFKGAAKTNFERVKRLGVDLRILRSEGDLDSLSELLRWADVVVDALFGVGLSREVTGIHRKVIERINSSKKPVVSVDIPSGVDGDTGRVMGVAVKARATVSFGLPKVGNLLYPGYELCGKLYVSHISYPPELYESDLLKIGINEPISLPPRKRDGHKGTFGKALFVAGAFGCLLYTSPSPRDLSTSRMPSSA